MLSSATVAFARLIAFVYVVACAIVTFYAAIHTIDINSHLGVFVGGMLALLIGIVAGPIYCLIAYYGLDHYFAVAPLAAVLLTVPVFLAWCYMVYSVSAGYLRG